MHIPDGFLDPKTWGALYGVSGGTTAYALHKVKDRLEGVKIPLIGITAAFIFAAQMLNFPVAGGTSGHYVGAILACVLLGPWEGFLTMVVVLLVQGLFFADGGLTALGANVFNMAIVGGLLSYFLLTLAKKPLAKRIDEKRSLLICTAFFSWFSVVLAASACAIELAISGTVPLSFTLPAMAGVHVLIGIGEAIIGTIVVAVVLQARPDLVDAYGYRPALLGTVSGEVA
ncbi:MAG: energy-coupling factor ABC transporter permease [Actinobacteria bacterium]|nr:energy-coupling factor ABC transporter permease [Actinomycetota bacterium]